ncbi:hypothetical protein C7974DRAFT_446230 [Boeremia exigua]|uniref:uncharacterized protein n=1 Tax=Boeremia exigua TaxID=749465 RepID=UPI001E8CA409|nr:uncharacterized protein C7974DRAFT_446230 [Boeremia exigua]KAH6641955.1 hypothetical protein C7974DRAFT_446230 [Boeremia exigua]
MVGSRIATTDSDPIIHLFPSSAPSYSYENSSSASVCDSNGNRLKVFLIQTAKGLFSSSGGYKANLCFLRFLASRGHSVRQLCYPHRGEVDTYVQTLARYGDRDPEHCSKRLHLRDEHGQPGIDVNVDYLALEDGVQIVALDKEAFDEAFGGKIDIHNVISKETAAYIEERRLSARLHDYVLFLQQETIRFAPTHIIFNDGLSMQATSALELPNLKACRIAVIHTAEQLPFGPFFGGMPGHVSSPCESKLLQELDGVWSVSNAIKTYALTHGRLATKFLVHHPWTYLDERTHGMPIHLHNWNKRFVGMINPCKVKGSQILASLAKMCPQHEFLVYKSWGFDDRVGEELTTLRNLTIRSSCTDMEEAWRDIKVLLVPSLWFEAWGIVVIEAHLRGIPVISSDAGALTEAMLGLDHVIPVVPIQGELDEEGEYIVPRQDTQPWKKTLNRRMSDKDEYERLSDKVRSVTQKWLWDIDERELERWLIDLPLRAG